MTARVQLEQVKRQKFIFEDKKSTADWCRTSLLIQSYIEQLPNTSEHSRLEVETSKYFFESQMKIYFSKTVHFLSA